MPARLIRSWKVWRFLPEIIKESAFPKQIEPAVIRFQAGTLYLYYILRNRHIIVIREPQQVLDPFRTIKRSRITKNFIETLYPTDTLIVDIADLVVTTITDSVNVNELLNYITASREFRWFRDSQAVLDSITYATFDKYVTTISEGIYVNDQMTINEYQRLIKTISEVQTVSDYRMYNIFEKKWWFFRDKLIVVDGIYGGYPSPEYPGKMQYFRVAVEKVQPYQYKFWVEEKVKETEQLPDSVSISDLITTKIVQVVRLEPIEDVTINELVEFLIKQRVKREYLESVSVSDLPIFLVGVLIPQTLTKVSANVFLEHTPVVDYLTQATSRVLSLITLDHPQFIDYQTQISTKSVSLVELGHPQVLEYQTQTVVRSVSIIELGHTQDISYVSQTLTKSLVDITISP